MARYIDADAFCKEIVKIQDLRRLSTATIGDALHRIPTADVVEVKHGEWTEEGYCPFCKCDMPAFIEDWKWKRCRTPYCPNCGADMRGGNDDSEMCTIGKGKETMSDDPNMSCKAY